MNAEEEAHHVSISMMETGGSFVKILGNLIAHADIANRQKIKDTWPEYWEEYLRRIHDE